MSFPDDNVRPRRDRHQPRHLDDYLVNLPQRQLLYTHPHSHSDAGYSRQRDSHEVPPAGQTQLLDSVAVLSALKEMQGENKQLWREMQHVLNAISPPHPAASHPAPASHSAPTPRHLHFVDNSVSFTQLPTPRVASTPLQPITQSVAPLDDELLEVVCTEPPAPSSTQPPQKRLSGHSRTLYIRIS